jgi:soluble lytic murein transglycosylase-like protein
MGCVPFKRARNFLPLLVLALTWASPASAQIYLWRDGNGNEVFSNMNTAPSGVPSKTYAVPHAESTIRTTNYVAPSRSAYYDDVIADHAQLNGLRVDLVRAVVQVESGFNAYAQSPKGAKGLMQLMPGTMKEFGVVNPYNPVENIRAGTAYLRQLLNRYDNNEQLALAAYNAGPKAVDKYGETVPPYRETRNYVAKIDKISSVRQLPATKIYQVTKIIDGREVIFFTDKKPQ